MSGNNEARDQRAARRAGPPQRHNNENQENIPPNINNITVMGAGLDTFIPTIPEVLDSDIKAKFPIQVLTPIEGKPTYKKLLNCERELGENALTVEVPFGAGTEDA